MRRLSLAGAGVAAACALTAGPASAAPVCAEVDTPLTAANEAVVTDAIRCLVTAHRAAVRLPAFVPDDRLTAAGGAHLRDMARRSFFAHRAPRPAPHGVMPSDRATAFGYRPEKIGEVLHANTTPTARAAVRGWLASPAHCPVVLDDQRYVAAGVAARRERGRATFTLLAARAAGTPAPDLPRRPRVCPGDARTRTAPAPRQAAAGGVLASGTAGGGALAASLARDARGGFVVRGRVRPRRAGVRVVVRVAGRATRVVRTRRGGRYAVRLAAPRGTRLLVVRVVLRRGAVAHTLRLTSR